MAISPVVSRIDWSVAFADRMDRVRPSEIREFLKLLGQPGVISFAGGIPDPELLPRSPIGAVAVEVLGDPVRGTQALQYATSEGYLPLREWIAGYMGTMGVVCGPEHIVLTSGSQQGLDLLGKVFIDPGDTVLVQAPTYLGALQAFNVYQPVYAEIGGTGSLDLGTTGAGTLRYAQGRLDCPAALPSLAYVMPEFANPSGESMSHAERERVLDLAERLDVPVIEDDAYHALRYGGEAVPSLLALDIARMGGIDRSRVIYAGTFSKTVSPGVRVGWLCAAQDVIRQLVLVRQAADLHSSMLDQMLVHGVVETGFEAQVARILPVYRHRRDAMLAALERHMPEGVTWTRPEGGMFIWLTLPGELDSRALVRESIETERVVFVPGTAFFAGGGGEEHGSRNARLNYTCSDDATIEDGIARLAALIRRHLERRQ